MTIKRQFPASSSSSCLRFSSSTEWWTFLLCYGHSGKKLWRFRSCVSWGRAMLWSTVDTYSASARATFGRIPGFLREWVDSALEVDSRPALLSSWPRTSSTTAVACFLLVLLVMTHLALCSRRLLSHRMEKCAQSMLRPPSSFFIENLDNISFSPLYFTVLSAVRRLR